ncbi:MAG: hypothetical protein FJ382_14335, partial [Verrucomicrobia bacterium]|nr:hypothetical protein [Verrucomicrobiota bacterium]
MKTRFTYFALLSGFLIGHAAGQTDPKADRESLPQIAKEFDIAYFAREPLVRNPCSIAFDERGRMFVS